MGEVCEDDYFCDGNVLFVYLVDLGFECFGVLCEGGVVVGDGVVEFVICECD